MIYLPVGYTSMTRAPAWGEKKIQDSKGESANL